MPYVYHEQDRLTVGEHNMYLDEARQFLAIIKTKIESIERFKEIRHAEELARINKPKEHAE
jgi:hypothetical protein